MKKLFRTLIFVSILIIWGEKSGFSQSDHILWYNKPADYFEESLVLGNGKMGASVFGGKNSDLILLNDATLWSGEPVNADMNPDAYTFIPAIRDALSKGDYRKANELQKKLQGSYSESYAPLGTMQIRMDHKNQAIDYKRELDLNNAISKVNYTVDGVKYTREYFVSYPAKIMVIKLSASKPASISGTISFESQLKYTGEGYGQKIKVNGYAPYHAEPSYRGDIPNAIMFNENRGTRFTTIISVRNRDGRVMCNNSEIRLEGCSEALIFVSIATSFNSFDKNPATQGLNNEVLAENVLENAESQTFKKLKSDHIKDYTTFFNRVKFSLGKTTAPDLPTDERLKRYATGAEDKNLEILYFQYGRYLMIAASRTAAVPMNLQGIWNPYMRPPWSSNYTLNINAEENYWAVETANLSEMHQPMMDFIANVAKTGAITAHNFFGTNGWTACHNSDIWAMSNPVGDFGGGDPCWANWYMGGAWLSTHLWEHFAFTQDKTFLREKAYPLMKGAVTFCLEWLVPDKEGFLITSPSTSPENIYIAPDGFRGATLYGATADIAMTRELFTDFLLACDALDIHDEFYEQVKTAKDKLRPYQIGKKGNLQEWYYDWEDAEPNHRHQSHLFGLYPGHQITSALTPELAAACRRILELRGDETTGWSMGWRINLWARLQDGNHAYKMMRSLLKYNPPDALRTPETHGGGTYPNLFDAHPPFQIDGNFGGTAAFIEMLMQSDYNNRIELLPALPDEWTEGNIDGIKARGGYEISFKWKNHKLLQSTIRAIKNGKVTLVYAGTERTLQLEAGKMVKLIW